MPRGLEAHLGLPATTSGRTSAIKCLSLQASHPIRHPGSPKHFDMLVIEIALS